MVLKKAKKERVAKDENENPLRFLFVNNLSGSDGTFEDPFPTLAEAQAQSQSGDFIYVFPGDGTTQGMNSGFIMQPRQTLAGSGTALPVATSEGMIIVPSLTPTNPTLTNPMGDGVTLANHCAISGINVAQASENGFHYDAICENSTLSFRHCAANNNSGKDSISASGGFAIAFLTDNVSVTASFENCVANANSGRGNGSAGGFAIGNGIASNCSITTTFINCLASRNRSDGSATIGGFSIGVDGFDNFSVNASFTNCSANAK